MTYASGVGPLVFTLKVLLRLSSRSRLQAGAVVGDVCIIRATVLGTHWAGGWTVCGGEQHACFCTGYHVHRIQARQLP
jgi:hypothetical protein